MARFNVNASGPTPIAFQWQKNGVPIPGETLTSLSVLAQYSESGARFSASASNAAGTTQSSSAVLSVTAVPPTIVSQPATATVTVGAAATFMVTVQGGTTPVAYQWQRNGSNILAATSPSYTLISAQATDSGTSYRVVLSNPFGSITSGVATLTVSQPPTGETIDGCSINVTTGCQAPQAGLRDKCKAPFSPESIWNVPLSQGAQTEAASIGPMAPTDKLYGDEAYWVTTANSDPIITWFDISDFFANRCTGSTQISTVPFPANLVVPDVVAPNTYNNSAAILHPNGRTITQMNALARCVWGGPVYGYRSPGDSSNGLGQYDIYGQGRTGGHGGSGLSSIGGTIRTGELTSSEPIAHALKVELRASNYLYQSPPYFVWPAVRADGYAQGNYGGTNPWVRMGSLLMLPATFACAQLSTNPGRKICAALTNYGAYIVDDSKDGHSFVVDQNVKADFLASNGYAFDSYSSPFRNDVNAMFSALRVVKSNSETSIGGGGQPRRAERAKCIGN